MVHGVKLIIDNIVIKSHVRYRHQMLHICLKSLLLKYSYLNDSLIIYIVINDIKNIDIRWHIFVFKFIL